MESIEHCRVLTSRVSRASALSVSFGVRESFSQGVQAAKFSNRTHFTQEDGRSRSISFRSLDAVVDAGVADDWKQC